MNPAELWRWLPLGWALTVATEMPVLVALISRAHPLRRRIACGAWLTACTYPIVILVLPAIVDPIGNRTVWVASAEVLAPALECLLFATAFHRGVPRRHRVRDALAIIAANLASFLAFEAWWRWA